MSKWMASRRRRGFCPHLLVVNRQRFRAKERTIFVLRRNTKWSNLYHPTKTKQKGHRFAKDGYIFLAKNDLRPAPGVRAPRWLWTCLRTISLQARRMARGNIHPTKTKQKGHRFGVLLFWLGWMGSNHRNARVKVWCLTAWLHPNIALVFYHILF